jgi:D-tyrosyl-tRNA(Tyr) deacylase
VRAVVQRVTSAKVTVGDRTTGEIGAGLLVLLGVEQGDGPSDLQYIASKIRDLRIFPEGGPPSRPEAATAGDAVVGDVREPTKVPKMNRSVLDTRGAVLVVSQFTLSGDARNGRRPSFASAAPPDIARALYEAVVRELQGSGLTVATGEFQAMMQVALVNDGPVTILLDSRKTF